MYLIIQEQNLYQIIIPIPPNKIQYACDFNILSNTNNYIEEENDLNLNIDWEYDISKENKSGKKNKDINDEDDEDNFDEKKLFKDSKKSDDEYGTFEDISLEDIDKDIPPINNKKEEKKEKEKDEKDKENFLISNENKQDKSRNFKQDNKIKNVTK